LILTYNLIKKEEFLNVVKLNILIEEKISNE